ncbi:MAG: helix-turn-helix transcriptional regulator [Fimbriimonadaceae bacterium]
MNAPWTFLTNHSHVLICISRNPEIKVREIAEKVGITERSAHRIVQELAEYGVVTIHKNGRRNVYRLNLDLPLRHPLERDQTVESLIRLVSGSSQLRAGSTAASAK